METKRKKFQGVLNILSFNRHFYVIGITAITIIILSQLYFQWSQALLWIIIGLFLYGLLMPLIVSAYVYDFSGYYNFDWLKSLQLEDSEKKLAVNINAGFDETSYILKNKFPKSKLQVFDFYNAEQHTEPAIVRARKVSLTYPNTSQIKTDYIPLQTNSVDIIFLLSAAHEIRSFNEKVQFLKECHRICKPNGKLIMVEHLRDFPNFLAFSVGFTHFFSRKHWETAFKNAGFSTFNENKFTPFMSVFNCQP
ncbi:class I SAM-dependent methyltransferase [Mangrovimonas spongiae]|uniref:Methyltransferase domain-containing protein n=1 Tax=Mangrovimonas spongiae TaxID=2494697 RepID=A0A3R9PMZ3_9FLAO|nr:methyltransferase domain-containing protein [Mangrovimonas spongiae]RSK42052.1 methyltransferase domain-containing protein [Mangrovimonas spongiae]